MCLENGAEAKLLEQFVEVGSEREGGKLGWGQIESVELWPKELELELVGKRHIYRRCDVTERRLNKVCI